MSNQWMEVIMTEKYDSNNELFRRMPEKWHPQELRNELGENEQKVVDVIVKILTDEAYFGNHETILKLVKCDLLDHIQGLEIEYARENKYEGEYGSQFI